MDQHRSNFGCSVIRDKVFLFGGHNGDGPVNTLDIFEAKTERFRVLKPMIAKRQGCAGDALGGYLYVTGGSSEKGPLDTVERYCV